MLHEFVCGLFERTPVSASTFMSVQHRAQRTATQPVLRFKAAPSATSSLGACHTGKMNKGSVMQEHKENTKTSKKHKLPRAGATRPCPHHAMMKHTPSGGGSVLPRSHSPASGAACPHGDRHCTFFSTTGFGGSAARVLRGKGGCEGQTRRVFLTVPSGAVSRPRGTAEGTDESVKKKQKTTTRKRPSRWPVVPAPGSSAPLPKNDPSYTK